MTIRPYQRIGNLLIDKINAREYLAGDKLPGERDIAASMGVSRAVVREAVIMLELFGFVDVRKGSGVYVKAIQGCGSIDDNSDVGPFELLHARQLVESTIARAAAASITKQDVVSLKKIIEQEKRELSQPANLAGTSVSSDKQFHYMLAQATKNSVLVNMMEMMWEQRSKSQMWRQLEKYISNYQYRQKWLQHHEVILQALIMKDADRAYQAMFDHIQEVKQTLFNHSDVENPEFDAFLFDFEPKKITL